MSAAGIVLILLAVFMVLGAGSCAACLCLGAAASPGKSGSKSTPAPEPTSDLPQSGEYGYVYMGKGDRSTVHLFPTSELLDKWHEAAGAKDYVKMAALATLAVKVPGGTRVKATGGSFLYKVVEVVEGPQRGRSGWVAKDFVHRSKM